MSKRGIVFPSDEGRTRQSMADECDVNLIMAKYQVTGAIDHFSRHSARYGFADSVSFHEAMTVVSEAERMFNDLPSVLRSRFQGDPGQFLDYVQDEANADEMIELGLRDPVPAQETPKARTEEVPPVGPPEAPAAVDAALASD